MKNIPIILFFVICAPCFAQIEQDINTLIKKDLPGLKKNFDSIQLEAAGLDETERLAVYNRHKKSEWVGGLINIFAPGGAGSFYQDDYVGGGIVLGGELLGLGTFFVGSMMFFIPVITIFPLFTKEGLQMIETGNDLMIAGGVMFAASWLFGVIRAFYYPNIYNKKLKTSLWPEPDFLPVSIIPSVNITGNGVEIMLVSMKW